MSLRILLVLPIREGNFQVGPDVGILYLGTVLQNAGHQVTLLDCPKEKFGFTDFKDFVKGGDFDVVGFRCYSRDHNYVNHHVRIVKRLNSRILTLAGRWTDSLRDLYDAAGYVKPDTATKVLVLRDGKEKEARAQIRLSLQARQAALSTAVACSGASSASAWAAVSSSIVSRA